MDPDRLLPARLRQVGEDNAEVVAPPPLFFLVPLLLGFGVELLAPTHVLDAPLRRGVGWTLLFAGLALPIWGAATLRAAGTHFLPERPSTAVVAAGPYRFTRNPMYLGMALGHAGVSILLDSWWMLATLPFAVALVTWGAIRREERYLERKFGESYLAYKRRVRRWV